MTLSKARTIFIWAGLLVASVPAFAQTYHEESYHESELRFSLGDFRPAGDSRYWNDSFNQFTGSASDFEDLSFGVDYMIHLAPQVGLIFSGTGFEGQGTQSYRGFVDQDGFRVQHDTTLDIAAFTAGVRFDLAPRRAPVRPYIGGGAGIYSWRLRESGDFIDLNTANNQIFTSRLRADGVAPGVFALVGLDVPVGRRVSIFAEGRYTWAKDTLNKDFEGFGKIDLSGSTVSAGVSFHL
jgi:Outer membrane protein beta-barrel domain